MRPGSPPLQVVGVGNANSGNTVVVDCNLSTLSGEQRAKFCTNPAPSPAPSSSANAGAQSSSEGSGEAEGGRAL
jgi:hypothetical protein